MVILPPLRITEDVVQMDFIPEGHLFLEMVGGITGARKRGVRLLRSAYPWRKDSELLSNGWSVG